MSDIRWKQRFSNYLKAYSDLKESITLAQTRPLVKLEKKGVIQDFEVTHELAWNVLKDYLQEQGHTNITGSRDASRLAFKMGLIQNGEAWMEMIKSRNLTSHTYDQEKADEIFDKILNKFFLEFTEIATEFSKRCDSE